MNQNIVSSERLIKRSLKVGDHSRPPRRSARVKMLIPGFRASATYCCRADSTGRGHRFYELKYARLKVVPKEHAILPKSRILILIAPVQNPPALAQHEQLGGVLLSAGRIAALAASRSCKRPSTSSRLPPSSKTSTAHFQILNASVSLGRSARLSWRPPGAGLGP
jgi:hypothetical protein